MVDHDQQRPKKNGDTIDIRSSAFIYGSDLSLIHFLSFSKLAVYNSENEDNLYPHASYYDCHDLVWLLLFFGFWVLGGTGLGRSSGSLGRRLDCSCHHTYSSSTLIRRHL